MQNIVKDKNLYSHIKKGKAFVTFGDIEIEKYKFQRYKSPIFILDGDINNMQVSGMVSSGEKSINILTFT